MKRKINKIKQYTLIKFAEDSYYAKNKGTTDFDPRDEVFIFMGEIPNMRGHVVVAGHTSGRVYSGYHDDNFVELTEDEV